MRSVEKTFINLDDGSRISAMTEGNMRGEIIVFVNGSIFNYKQFLMQLYPRISTKLPQNYSYIFYDYVGIGESSELQGGFDFKRIADQHRMLLDALGIEKAHHFGYSKGAVISMMVAERAQSIGTIGTPNLSYKTDEQIQRMAMRKKSLEGILHFRERKIDDETYPVLYKEVFESVIFGTHKLSFLERIKSFLIRRFGKDMLYGTPISSVIDLYTMYSEPHNYEKYFEDIVRKIDVPVLMMHGEDDSTVPVDGVRELNKMIEGSELKVYPGYTHTGPAFNKSQAEQIAKDYTTFLLNL